MARKKSKANYFTSETEDYIKRYNVSIDSDYRAKIFTDHIYLPFYKLAENIIHTFKFYYTDVEKIEDLKHEIVAVLLEEKIMKFDPDNGAKAYSYFGTIVKRWLINYNNKNYKRLKQVGSFSDIEDSFEVTLDLDSPSAISLSNFLDEWVGEMYEDLDDMFMKDSDKQIADAVLTIFKTRHDLDLFKKKALYIYIREMTECETPHLTKVISVLKEEWMRKYLFYYDQGLLNNNPL
jgi:hypothetical protein|tara:strand:+ start:5758 stop:6462 length:705 start_codon:yes stop_codon:yes gene_type:complete